MRRPPPSSAPLLVVLMAAAAGCGGEASFEEQVESYCRDQLAGKIHGVVSIGEEGDIPGASIDLCVEQAETFQTTSGVSEETYLAYIDCSRAARSDEATRSCAEHLLEGARGS